MAKTTTLRFRWWLTWALVVIAVGCAVWWWWRSDYTLKSVTDSIASFNAFVVFALMATLPVVGFSVSVIYLVAGVKFGPMLGGVAVTGATAAHLLLTHWICRSVLRERLQRFLARRNHHLPHVPAGENASIAAMAALVPGLPYFARNYLLALTDVPLRTYFWICLPIYVARSYVAILLGDFGGEPDRQTLILLALVYVVKLSICAYLLWRIRKRFKLAKARQDALGLDEKANGPGAIGSPME
jgi:uncharacterized membrane protein YdjX (TVP38/TMEM64 family)